jgi:hypothetical protein
MTEENSEFNQDDEPCDDSLIIDYELLRILALSQPDLSPINRSTNNMGLITTDIDKLFSENIEELINRAKRGDVLEARRLVIFIQRFMQNPEILNMPEALKEYAVSVLGAIAGGAAAEKALNISRKGRSQTWSVWSKRLATSIVQKFIERGNSIDEACAQASDFISENITELSEKPYGAQTAWGEFVGRPHLSEDILRVWYYELKRSSK